MENTENASLNEHSDNDASDVNGFDVGIRYSCSVVVVDASASFHDPTKNTEEFNASQKYTDYYIWGRLIGTHGGVSAMKILDVRGSGLDVNEKAQHIIDICHDDDELIGYANIFLGDDVESDIARAAGEGDLSGLDFPVASVQAAFVIFTNGQGQADEAGLVANLCKDFQLCLRPEDDNLHEQDTDSSDTKQSFYDHAENSRTGEAKHLKRIDGRIRHLERIINSLPDEAVVKPDCLVSLGGFLHTRSHSNKEDPSDIEEAIRIQQDAVNHLPDNVLTKSANLFILGNSLMCRYYRLRILSDFDQAIQVKRLGINLLPRGPPGALEQSQNLCFLLEQRCYDCEDVPSIDSLGDTIGMCENTVELTPESHPQKLKLLHLLSRLYISRNGYNGDPSDVDRAVISLRHCVKLSPDSPSYLTLLGNVLNRRYNSFNEVRDNDEALVVLNRAVDLEFGKVDEPKSLFELGAALRARASGLDDPYSTEELILRLRKAISTPKKRQDKMTILVTLAYCLHDRYHLLESPDDQKEALNLYEQVLDIIPEGHRFRDLVENHYAILLMESFKRHHGPPEFLNKSIQTMQQLLLRVDSTRSNTWGDFQFNLGHAFADRYDYRHQRIDFDSAVTALRKCCQTQSCLPDVRMHASGLWMSLARSERDLDSFMEATQYTMNLIPQVVWLGESWNRRLDKLRCVKGHVDAVVAFSIQHGKSREAVQWMEQSRNIFWRQILQLRTPTDELRLENPLLAEKLEVTSRALDNAEIGLDSSNLRSTGSESQRKLARNYENIVSEVRKLEGFESFLTPNNSQKLAEAAETGPVVMITATHAQGSACHALILYVCGCVIPVCLHDVSLKDLEEMRATLESCFGVNAGEMYTSWQQNHRGHRGQMPPQKTDKARRVLDYLWRLVVEPIVEKLDELQRESKDDHYHFHHNSEHHLPHITWCLTGPLAFLPVHAAGNYNSPSNIPRRRAYELFVSSYAPYLSSLLDHQELLSTHGNVLAISMTETAGHSSTPGTQAEVRAVQKNTEELTWLEGEKATVTTVLKSINDHEIVHFACHAVQNISSPLKSAFILADGELTLEDLIRQNYKHKDLAFLSACETAVGDGTRPEEAIHLAAGMMAAGFQSVIGTMWAILDNDAVGVADAFYAKLKELRTQRQEHRRHFIKLGHQNVELVRLEINKKEKIAQLGIKIGAGVTIQCSKAAKKMIKSAASASKKVCFGRTADSTLEVFIEILDRLGEENFVNWVVGERTVEVELTLDSILAKQSLRRGGSVIADALHHAVKSLRDEIGEDQLARWIPFVHYGQ